MLNFLTVTRSLFHLITAVLVGSAQSEIAYIFLTIFVCVLWHGILIERTFVILSETRVLYQNKIL